MCYICSCFTNCLDLIQRIITFGLGCILCCAVCLGLTVAIIAGIAYGYNYCMAEFITFTRSDVTVYMRRGQFYDQPDMPLNFRRSGARAGGEEDLFGLNRTTDYEEPAPAHGKPLSDSWMKSQDTRKYAEKLTKYSPPKFVENPVRPAVLQDPIAQSVQVESYRKSPDSQVISIPPNILIPTVAWNSEASTIVMSNYKPVQDISRPDFGMPHAMPEELSLTTEPNVKSISFVGGRHKNNNLGSAKLHVVTPQSYVPLRQWTTTRRSLLPEYVTEEVDEDNIVYKPV